MEITELTGFQTGEALKPAGAYLVRNSDVNPCKTHETAVSADKQPMHSHFDRCAPSILAFHNEAAARAYAAQHGGQVLPFADLASQFAH